MPTTTPICAPTPYLATHNVAHELFAWKPYGARRPLRVYLTRLLILTALLGLGVSFAACVPEDYAQELELTGFGTVYVGDLEYNSARDEARLFNGVCFTAAGESGLTLTAPTMRVEQVQTNPTFETEAATLQLQTFTLFAERLSGDAVGLSMQNLSVLSPQFSGGAVRARHTLADGRTILTGVNLRLGDFRVQSVAAGLNATTLVLQDARATTCACENGGLYVLSAPGVTIDLQTGVVQVDEGTLETLGLRLALDPDLRLLPGGAPTRRGTTVLPGVAVPEPVGTVIDQGTKLAVPVQLFPGASLELGAAGFSQKYPVSLVSLLNLGFELGPSNLRAALGRVGPGLRADALIRTPLAPGVGFDISTTNRDWQAADFIHEGALGLHASHSLTGVMAELTDSLVLSGQLFAALSRQTLAGTVVQSPRLGGRGTVLYTGVPGPAGTFALQTETGLTYYPGSPQHPSQFGVRVAPSWRKRFGPLRAALNFEHQAVFGKSPFTTNLDRLLPSSVVGGSLSLTALGGVANVQGRYAFRLQNARNPVRLARLEVARALPFGALTLRNRLTVEVAGLLGPADAKVDAFVGAETRFELPASELEFGVQARYNLLPTSPGLELLEAYASYPLTFSAVTLRPFLALNAAPLFSDRPLPIVTGYGLELRVGSCCGTFVASYRLHDKSVRAAFDVRLSPDPEFASR